MKIISAAIVLVAGAVLIAAASWLYGTQSTQNRATAEPIFFCAIIVCLAGFISWCFYTFFSPAPPDDDTAAPLSEEPTDAPTPGDRDRPGPGRGT